MISKVKVTNFKCLRDVLIELERFTIFVGPNASGKSSILRALDLLCWAFRPARGAGAQFGGATIPFPGGIPGQVPNLDAELLLAASRGSKEPVELVAEARGKWYRYRTPSPSPQPNPSPGRNPPPWAGEGTGVAADLGTSAWSFWKLAPGHSPPLPLSVLLRLEASKLVQPNPSGDSTEMAPDGTGLHSALAGMTLNDPDSWKRLQDDLKLVIPTIRRLRHTKSVNIHQPSSLLFDTDGADSLPASQVSEGTLLVLGLLTALHSAGRPNLVLLDDLDRGLHPRAQKELITLLRGLLKTNPDLQVIATTHSPYMLDCMETNEVRMTLLREDGSTVCAGLTSHPKFEKWKDEMTPGEMWSLFGEKWLVEKEATP